MSRRATPFLTGLARNELGKIRSARAEATAEQIQKVVKPYIPHRPSHKQFSFLELDAQEGLYGGAAGGGKSDALIMGALQFIDRPNYAAHLMRLHEVDLSKDGAILDRAKKWFAGTAARWDGALKGFRFPSGASLSFGHFSRGGPRGPEYQYIGIDEITEWEEQDYLFMFGRLRALVGGVPTRMRGGTNPGGIGHEWVWDRFVRHARQLGTGLEYEGWRKGGRLGTPVFESPASQQVVDLARQLGVRAQGAFFVPAFAEDNPALDVVGYRMNLARLDPVEYAWFAEGDWTAKPSGKVFQRDWFTNYLDQEPPGVIWLRYWDLAGTDPDAPGAKTKDPAWSAGVKEGLQHLPGGSLRLVIADVVRERKEPSDLDAVVLATAELDGKMVTVVIEQEPGSAGKSVVKGFARNVLAGWDVHADKKTGSKEEMWRPLASLARAGGVYLVRGPWNADFVKELAGLPAGKKDQADAAAGGYAWLLENGYSIAEAAVDTDDTRESPWHE